MEYRERYVTAHDGLALYVRDYGDPLSDRIPVLCLTGLTRNSKDFHQVARRLCPSRRVICPEYRGRGRSAHDPDWRHYLPQTYLNDIGAVLAALNVHRVVVIGTSLGGLLAMGLGAALPSALAGVVLNDIGPEIDGAGFQVIVDYIRNDRPQPDLESAAASLEKILPNLSHRDPGIWRQLAENTYREQDDGLLHFDWDPAIVEPILRDPALPDLWPLFRSLRHIPLMAVRGGISDLTSAGCLDRMAAEIPGMVTITVPDTGHAPTLSEPEVEDVLDDFVARL